MCVHHFITAERKVRWRNFELFCRLTKRGERSFPSPCMLLFSLVLFCNGIYHCCEIYIITPRLSMLDSKPVSKQHVCVIWTLAGKSAKKNTISPVDRMRMCIDINYPISLRSHCFIIHTDKTKYA